MADIWRGRTYHIQSGTEANPNKKHLFIVLSEPDTDGLVLAVSLTSTIKTDKTCIIDIGEDPFITKKSYVAYNFLEIMKTSFFHSEESNRDTDASEHLLEKICDGITKSDFVKPQYLKFYKKNRNNS